MNNKKIISLLLIAMLSVQSFGVVFAKDGVDYQNGETIGKPDTSDWFTWDWPNDKEAYGTAIDASFLTEKPAGKHGFMKADGDKFVFEDGTPFRVWGCCSGTQANFMSKEDQEALADRLAREGFNAVRIHGFGNGTADNIFGSGTVSSVTKVDPGQLDKLFYYLHCLKERGIYWYLDLYVLRQYIPDDILLDVRTGYGINLFFAPDVIESLKEVYRQVLGTVNPYTGMTIAEDPALMGISLSNERTVLEGGASADYDNAILEADYNRWLINKYSSRAALEAAWLEEGKQGLRPDEDCMNGTVDFMGDGTKKLNPYYNAQKYSKQRRQDAIYFLCEVQEKYYANMVDFFRNELGTKCMFTACDMGNEYNQNIIQLQIASDMDYTSSHMYKAHPTDFAYAAGAQLTGWTSTTQVLGSELWRTPPWMNNYQQPFIMGEWDSVAPGPYGAEGIATHSVVSAYQNWNDMYFAAYSKTEMLPNSAHDEYFAHIQCADLSSVLPAASVIYKRGDIKQAETSYYLTTNKAESTELANYGVVSTGLNDIWMYLKTGTYFEDDKRDIDYEPTPEALEKAYEMYDNNEFPNEQIQWNRRNGIFKTETEYTNLATGRIGDKKIDFDYSAIELKQYTAVVALTSMTEETLKESDSVLLTTISRSRNTNLEYSDDHYTMEAPGSGPQVIEPVKADITIKTAPDEEIEVYALDFSGKRKQKLTVTKDENGYSKFTADGNIYKAVHYEIVNK